MNDLHVPVHGIPVLLSECCFLSIVMSGPGFWLIWWTTQGWFATLLSVVTCTMARSVCVELHAVHLHRYFVNTAHCRHLVTHSCRSFVECWQKTFTSYAGTEIAAASWNCFAFSSFFLEVSFLCLWDVMKVIDEKFIIMSVYFLCLLTFSFFGSFLCTSF